MQKKDPEPVKLRLADFDEAISLIGNWNRFQFGLIALLCVTLFNLAYMAYSPILILYTPPYKCAPNPKLVKMVHDFNVTTKTPRAAKTLMDRYTYPRDYRGRPEKCSMFNLDGIEFVSNKTHGTNITDSLETENMTMIDMSDSLDNATISFQVIGCEFGYQYDADFTTISMEKDWVCSEAWRGPFSQSIFFAGGVVGTIIFGIAIDYVGRVIVYMVANIIVVVTGICTSFAAENFYLFLALRFSMGLTHVTFYTSLMMLAMEYVSPQRRSLVCNFGLAISLTIGGAIQPWIISAVGDWKIFNIILFGQGLYIFLAPFLIKESIRWLATRRRPEDCVNTFTAIAKVNGQKISAEELIAFERLVDKTIADQEVAPDAKVVEGNVKQASLLDLFKTPRLRRNTIIATITWMLISSVFDGHIRNVVNLKYSIEVTFTIAALLEFPADIGAIYMLDYLGRRWSGFVSLMMSAVTTGITALCLEYVKMSVILALTARFFITFAMNTGIQLTMEIMPTNLRGQGTAFVNVFGQMAMFFSPYFVHSAIIDERLPFVIFTIGAVIAAVLILILPETADEVLPDTIAEAEAFGTHHPQGGLFDKGGFFFMPWLHSRGNRVAASDPPETAPK